MNKNGFSVKDIEEAQHVEYAAAYGLIQFLVAKKFIEDSGERRKAEGAKGKGQTLYKVCDACPEALLTLIFNEDFTAFNRMKSDVVREGLNTLKELIPGFDKASIR